MNGRLQAGSRFTWIGPLLISARWPGWSVRTTLDPVFAAKVDELTDGADDDEHPREAIALRPPELRDFSEVLAVQSDDEGGGQEDGGDEREPLHDLVLVVGDRSLVVIANATDEISCRVEALTRSK